ncbi:pyridoxal phosphate-dependent transferase [Dactylonectria macrodidyma]|uniref:Pyridoxal phosphate-dependent transferase n=1 Tax=Dactylonectria macrodidyma TaxID=307937 RepID=A0A9P9ESY2_9HYPO|nr:pyridoxal phosphate-dependent transferase [Dactylonectria macrodidyma]
MTRPILLVNHSRHFASSSSRSLPRPSLALQERGYLRPSVTTPRLALPLKSPRRGFTCSTATMSPAADLPEGSHNAWIGSKGPAVFDLRSDVVTTPTPAMLEAVQSCSLFDDVFQEDVATNELEAYLAQRTGKEAGLFVLSGTMGNQLAMRSLLTQPPHSVICDYRAHLYTSEAGGLATLSGGQITPVVPKNGRFLTLEDVMANATLDDDVHGCPTRVISLENTLHGMVMPLSEVKRISEFAREHGIKMHCDGARLWEAVVSGAGSLPDFCYHFDTISLCLSKGLGAPVGSVLVGPKDTLKHARWVRKSIGGGLRQTGVVTSAGRVAVEQTFGSSPTGSDGLLKQSHEMARKVEELWTSMGGKIAEPTETNMCWLDINAAGCSQKRLIEYGAEAGLKFMCNRLVTHYQVAQNEEEVLRRLRVAFEKILSSGEDLNASQKVGKSSVYRAE